MEAQQKFRVPVDGGENVDASGSLSVTLKEGRPFLAAELVALDFGGSKILQFVGQKIEALSASVVPQTVLESAFENTKPYELTERGSQFVHYGWMK